MFILPGLDTKERLARQRQQVNAQLGLDTMAVLGVDTSDIVSEEDITNATVSSAKVDNKVRFRTLLAQNKLFLSVRNAMVSYLYF